MTFCVLQILKLTSLHSLIARVGNLKVIIMTRRLNDATPAEWDAASEKANQGKITVCKRCENISDELSGDLCYHCAPVTTEEDYVTLPTVTPTDIFNMQRNMEAKAEEHKRKAKQNRLDQALDLIAKATRDVPLNHGLTSDEVTFLLSNVSLARDDNNNLIIQDVFTDVHGSVHGKVHGTQF
jgi:hypothetical protein